MKAIALMALAGLFLFMATAFAADIHDAAGEGDVERVRSILADDPDQLTTPNERNEMPIHVAAAGGHIDVVRLLLDEGVEVDIGDNENSTALDVAAIFDHAELAEYLVQRGADLSHADDNGMTPLHFACYNSNVDIARFLIESGADVHATTTRNSIPLHGAAYDGDLDCIRLLLEHGASPHVRNAAGFTPVLSAAAGPAELDAVRLLVEHGGDIHDRTLQGDTAIMYAAMMGKTEVAQYLIDEGVSLDARNDFGWTVILNATEAGEIDMLTTLLDLGASPNSTDTHGRGALWWACTRGNLDAATLLIERGADVNADPPGNFTSLMRAMNVGNREICALLLEHGVDVNVPESNSGRTVLHGAALKGWTGFVELFLDNGADYDLVDNDGMTPIQYAGKYGHRDVAELLESRGADVTGMEKNYGSNPLLERDIDAGEASLWYLGHCGWGVKTENHFLIFDYWKGAGEDPASPCLANGRISSEELADENVYLFVTHEHGDHWDYETINGWEAEFDEITYVFGFRPELQPVYRDTVYSGPEYQYIGPRETAEIDGMEIRTLAANDAGVGFLIEVDGVTLYHAGDHAGWADDERDGFFEEIDYLTPYVGDLDIAFINVTGCHAHDPDRLREGNVYTANAFTPNVFIPTHASDREYVYAEEAAALTEAGVASTFCCPANRGDGYFYNGTITE